MSPLDEFDMRMCVTETCRHSVEDECRGRDESIF